MVATPAGFRNAPAASVTNSFAELPWWDLYRDATLKGLIQTALTNNFDLRVAVTRVEQSRALVKQARAEFFPSAGYEGTAARGQNSFLGNPLPPNSGATPRSFAGLLDAAWEIDLWGRIRRLNESARADFLASEEARRGVTLTLISDVATAYFELLELESELEIARRTTNSFGDSLRIFTERLQGGVASELETSRAQAALSTTAALVPNLERLLVLKEDQISLLLGRPPGPIPRGGTLLEQTTPPDIAPGLPSELLERRPDIRQAEARARSANAQIGVALGDFLPRLGLSAFYGGVSPELSQITSSGANVWSAVANVSGPIFQGGRLTGRYQQVKAAWEEARIHYEQTALTAFQEVADALISRQKLEDVRGQQERAVRAYREAVKVSLERYTAGRASYYEVLEAQQQLFPAENSLAQTQLNQLLAVVQLYKALGGGWETGLLGAEVRTSAKP